MIEPRRIPKNAIPAALEKALRYRLLNEPLEAESICRDVLAVEPENQTALITLLLALTDQFATALGSALESAKEVLGQVQGDYERAYYEGIIHERWGKAHLVRNMPPDSTFGWFREAMRCFDRAAQIRPPDDPDAILRWNTCARFLASHESETTRHSGATHGATHDVVGEYGDDVPPA